MYVNPSSLENLDVNNMSSLKNMLRTQDCFTDNKGGKQFQGGGDIIGREYHIKVVSNVLCFLRLI